MKNIFLSLLFIISISSFATHNRAGEITYKRIPPYTIGTSTVPVYTYSITLVRYTDEGNGIADRCQDTIYFGDGQSAAVLRMNGSNTPCSCAPAFCGEIINNDPAYMVKLNIYSITHTYSSPGTYTVSVYDPNRNNGVVNIPNSVNIPFYVESVIVINPSNAPNASPILTNRPIDMGRLGATYYHTAAAYDPDGDSLSYQLTTCKSAANQTVPGYTYPGAGPGGSFSISPQGFVTWSVSQSVGEYNIAFVISEWRKTNCNGTYQFIGSVTRDMQVVIKPNASSPTISIAPLSDTCVVAGTSFSRNISVTSSSLANFTLLGAASNTLVGNYGVINPMNGTGNFTSTFFWNTDCGNAGNQTQEVIFSIYQSPDTYFKYYSGFRFKIVPPAPVITSVAIDTAMVKITWNKLSCAANIKGYNIYRKTTLNTWTHSPCENGVPAYSGFYPIGFNIPTDTTFTDTNFWGITNGSPGNYIVTAVTNDCTESFADTIKAVAYVVGLKENLLDDNSISVYPNPVSNEINIDFAEPFKGEARISLFSVQGQLLFEQVSNDAEHLEIRRPLLETGIYFLEIKTEKGLIVKKVIRE